MSCGVFDSWPVMQVAGETGIPAVGNVSEATAPVKKERKPRKKRESDDRSAADLYGDSVKVSAADGFVEDGLAWDEMV